MNFFANDPSLFPGGADRLPRDQVRIQSLTAKPYPDGRRVLVNLTMTPFLERPYLEIALIDAHEVVQATASFVEAISPDLEFTLHIRKPGQDGVPGMFSLHARLFYPEQPDNDHKEIRFEIAPAE